MLLVHKVPAYEVVYKYPVSKSLATTVLGDVKPDTISQRYTILTLLTPALAFPISIATHIKQALSKIVISYNGTICFPLGV